MNKRFAKSIASVAGCCLAVLSFASAAEAHWGMPQELPVDRVIRNLEEWVKEHPTDDAALYSLARARSYAFGSAAGTISGHGEEKRFTVSFGPGSMRIAPDPAKNLHTALKHLDAGIQAFNSVIKLRPTTAVYRYGLACLLEDGLGVRREAKAFPMLDVEVVKKDIADWLGDGTDLKEGGDKLKLLRETLFPSHGFGYQSEETIHAAEWVLVRARNKAGDATPAAVTDLLADAWVSEMNDLYFSAACMALPQESKAVEQGLTGLKDFVAWQSAKDYLRVSESGTGKENYQVRKATAKAVVKALESLPPCSAITPLVIPVEDVASINDVVDQHAIVHFDLDGTGRKQTYSWLTSHAGLLVWDPEHAGKITSGRQLFGTATWWLFFKDGFAALASLDDNQDGFIRGDELSGLAVWVDSNGNGISDPGEVNPIQKLSITSLSCRSTGHDGASLISSGGVEFADGARRPLWDWITTPLSIEQTAELKK